MGEASHHTRMHLLCAIRWDVVVHGRRVTALRSPRWCVRRIMGLVVALSSIWDSIGSTFKAHGICTAKAAVIMPTLERLVARLQNMATIMTVVWMMIVNGATLIGVLRRHCNLPMVREHTVVPRQRRVFLSKRKCSNKCIRGAVTTETVLTLDFPRW